VNVLSIERVEVAEKDIRAVVRVRDLGLMRTSAATGLVARALELLPGLERHSCENDAHVRFADELADTEAPHLLEHVAVELMALAGSPRALPARTSWDFSADGRGVFRLQLAYDDDLVALGALKEADLICDWLYGCGVKPDVPAIAERLRELRANG